MQITRKIIFHAGHMLKDDESKCYNPHGHEYVLECTVEGEVDKVGAESGMVMHFGVLKAIMMSQIHDRFDHKFIIEDRDPRLDKFIEAVSDSPCVIVDFPPTAENLIVHIISIMGVGLLPYDGVRLSKVRLQETSNCWAEWEAL